MGAVIYRMYNRMGDLLYIGKSVRIDERIHDHANNKEWWKEISNITLEHVDPENLDELEILYIQRENPLYNKIRYTNDLGSLLQVVSRFIDARKALRVEDYPSGLLEVLDFLDKKCQWPPYSGLRKFEKNLDWICDTLKPYSVNNSLEVYELVKFMNLWTKYMMFRVKVNAVIR